VVECFTDERVSPAVAPGYVFGTPKQHVERELGLADVTDFQDLVQRSSLEGHHHQHIGIRFHPSCPSCHRAEQNHLFRGERLHQALGEGLQSLLRNERSHSHGSIIAGPARVIPFGQAHRRFRFDLRYRALLGGSRRQLEQQLAQGFPFLPPGCRLVLDRMASERVLSNLRQCLPSRRPQLLAELRALAAEGVITPASGLANWLDALAMDPADFYGIRGVSFTALRRELDWLGDAPHPGEERLSRALAAGLLHLDDPDRLRSTAASLAAAAPPDPESLGERERRQWAMLFAQLLGTGRHWLPLGEALALLWALGPWREELRQLLELRADRADHRLHPLPWALPVPLRMYGRTYREEGRAEVLAAFAAVDERGAPRSHSEGVLWHQPTATGLLFITLRLPGRRPACRRH